MLTILYASNSTSVTWGKSRAKSTTMDRWQHLYTYGNIYISRRETSRKPVVCRNKLSFNEQVTTNSYLQSNSTFSINWFNMKFLLPLLTLLAGFAMASPAVVGDLEAREDCSTCGCSSVESCTVSSSPVWTSMLDRDMLKPLRQFDVSLRYVIDFINCWQNTNSGGGLSAVK